MQASAVSQQPSDKLADRDSPRSKVRGSNKKSKSRSKVLAHEEHLTIGTSWDQAPHPASSRSATSDPRPQRRQIPRPPQGRNVDGISDILRRLGRPHCFTWLLIHFSPPPAVSSSFFPPEAFAFTSFVLLPSPFTSLLPPALALQHRLPMCRHRTLSASAGHYAPTHTSRLTGCCYHLDVRCTGYAREDRQLP